MKFAADLFHQAADFYRSALPKAQDSGLKEALSGLLEQAGKYEALMERIRRENVTEMILEPVTGLSPDDYLAEARPREDAGDEGLIRATLALETAQQMFFERASARVALPEAARAFRKIAEKNKASLDRLKALRTG